MCDSLDKEIDRMASNFQDQHGRDVSGIAALVHVSRCLFQHYEEQHDLSLSALLRLQQECVSTWLGDRGIDWQEVEVALRSLDRANHVAEYLAGLPA